MEECCHEGSEFDDVGEYVTKITLSGRTVRNMNLLKAQLRSPNGTELIHRSQRTEPGQKDRKIILAD